MHLYIRSQDKILIKVWLSMLIQCFTSVMYALNYTGLINVEYVTLNNSFLYIFTVVMKHTSKTRYMQILQWIFLQNCYAYGIQSMHIHITRSGLAA